MEPYPFTVISDVINNSYARAARGFQARDVEQYQHLAQTQEKCGAHFLDVNIDATQKLMVSLQEMLDFLPNLIPALQEATDLPLCFDNPAVAFHEKALSLYKRTENNKPILNSIAASRENLDRFIELVAEYDTRVIAMASEKFVESGGAPCTSATDVYQTAKRHVEMLCERAGRTPDDIIIDPGLAPIAADTYGLVNMGLDAMKRIRADEDLAGVHISVGLTNFSFGVPKAIRVPLQQAYITLSLEAGLDTILGNPEHDLTPLDPHSQTLEVVRRALENGRPQGEESQEDAGFRQAETIMELYMDTADDF